MGQKLLKFKLIENDQVVHTGEIYSQFIPLLYDIYLKPYNRYSLVIEYNGVELPTINNFYKGMR
jgi:hypothetical protein